jgi:D-arginine dehydrogenase
MVTSVAGHRVFAKDHGPIVGEEPTREGLFWAAAMGGSGIMAAPAVADAVASQILGGKPQIDMTQLSAGRFDFRE